MPRQKSASGRLTQWMWVCKCFTAPGPEGPDLPEVDICLQCGKRFDAGRAGSLTQWIFRADLCSCDNPLPRPSAEMAAMAVSELEAQQFTTDELPVLSLSAANFPLERYTPHSVIGQGSSGCVYLCTDKTLDKLVAVKVLHNLSATELVSFQQEAIATSQLKHVGIVNVLDFGATTSGFPYMVLEFIDGTSLEILISQHGPLEPTEALFVADQLAEALAYAHGRGLYHRDIKPSNVIIVKERSGKLSARLIDFGVGIWKDNADLEGAEAQRVTIVGTPAYMSPDQALGMPFNNRSEIYSFGCVLFRMLTGSPPFVGVSSLETISMHAYNQAPLLRDMCDSEFPEELEKLVAKCLKKSQEERFQTMEELRDALRETALAIRELSKQKLEQTASGREERKPLSTRALVLAFLAILISGVTIYGATALIFNKTETPLTIPKIVSKKDPKFSDMFKFSSQLWYPQTGEFGLRVWISSPETQDKDFKKLLKEPKVDAILVTAHSNIDGSGFKDIASLPLRYINFQSPLLTDDAFARICRYKTLHDLRLAQSSLLTKNAYARLANLTNLELIDFFQVEIPEELFDILSRMKSLKAISFAKSTPITKEGLSRLATLPNLEYLDLTDTNVDNSFLPALAKFERMEELLLDGLGLTDENLECLAEMSQLRSLHICKSKITDRGIGKIRKIKKLNTLLIDACPGVSDEVAKGLKLRGINVSRSAAGPLSFDQMFSENLLPEPEIGRVSANE